MNETSIRQLLDACFTAKHVVETMKELPKGFKPRHIHVIEAVYELSADQEEVRVSDVSRHLNITTPSVTKLIQELEERGTLEKYQQREDKRVTLVTLTDFGRELQRKYVAEYHRVWSERMQDITEEEVKTVIRVIARLEETIPGGKDE